VRVLLVLLVLLTATRALADDADLYAGATLEGGHDLGMRTGAGVEVGVRAAGQMWLRGHLVGGRFTPFQLGGRYGIAAVGLEGRHCAASGVCLVGGVDAGAALLRWDADHDSIVVEGNGGKPYQAPDDIGFVAMPRLGVEFAARRVALRFALQGMVSAVGDSPPVGATLTTSLLARF
jgi:hypothetical protein